MQYEPVKRTLGSLFTRKPRTRRLFYRLLDILLLRSWHVRRVLRAFAARQGTRKCVRVLDAGSGFGQYSWYMARSFPRWLVTGIDVKKEEIEACKAFVARSGKQNIRFREADLRGFVMPGFYDLIVSVDVMEHIEEDETVFRNFFHSLKPEGMLLVNTPSDKGGSGVHRAGDSSFIDEHVRDGYAPAEIAEKLESAGFTQVETRYTYGWPGNIAWHVSMRIPLQLLGRSRLFLAALPVYYLLCMPFVAVLNYADLICNHKRGTGLMVTAYKKTTQTRKKEGRTSP